METPPPYMPPRKKSNTGLIIGLVIGGLLLCCLGFVVVLGGGGYLMMKKAMPMAECTISFGFAQQAVRAYADAHDGHLPNAETWQDDVKEYYKKASSRLADQQKDSPVTISSFPADGDWACKNDSGPSGIAFNTELSGKKISDVKNSDEAVMLFETDAHGRNIHEKYTEKSFESSPKIFGSPRGWLIAPLQGQVATLKNGHRVDINVNTTAGG